MESIERTIKLTQLDMAVEDVFSNGKYSLVFDKTHNAEVFFRYKAHMIEVNKLSIGVSIGKSTKEEAIEQIRKGLVYAMRSGDRLVLYVGNIAPDFKTGMTSDDSNFPAEKVFNFAEWRKEEHYKKIVREAEDVDLMGNKKIFWMNDKFNIVILAEYDDEETK
jgi:hypothetical protein